MLLAYLIVAVGLTVDTSSACSCFTDHIQNVMCDDRPRAVFKGRVHAKADSSERGYRVNEVVVEKVFKDTTSSLERGRTVEVKTPTESSMCIIDLQEGTTYLIDASYYDEEFTTNACSRTRRWPAFPTESATLSSTLRDPDCSCMVRICGAGHWLCIMELASADECYMSLSASDPKCRTEYSSCTQVDGSCTWRPAISADCQDDLLL